MTSSQLFMSMFPTISLESSSPCIALLGGGGKTSLLQQLGKEFAYKYNRVLITSITKAGPSKNFPITFTSDSGEISMTQLFKSQNPLYLLKEKIKNDKYLGISPSRLESLKEKADVTIFECDGARNLPLKAHSHWDPIVPDFASHAVILIGADVINTKLKDGKVHRSELFKTTWKVHDNTIIDIPLITKVVTDKRGYLSKIPPEIKKIYFINKANICLNLAEDLASSIYSTTGNKVFYGSIDKAWWKRVK